MSFPSVSRSSGATATISACCSSPMRSNPPTPSGKSVRRYVLADGGAVRPVHARQRGSVPGRVAQGAPERSRGRGARGGRGNRDDARALPEKSQAPGALRARSAHAAQAPRQGRGIEPPQRRDLGRRGREPFLCAELVRRGGELARALLGG